MKRKITRRKKKEDVSCLYELRYYVRESKDEDFVDYMVLSHASDRTSVEEAAENMGIDLSTFLFNYYFYIGLLFFAHLY